MNPGSLSHQQGRTRRPPQQQTHRHARCRRTTAAAAFVIKEDSATNDGAPFCPCFNRFPIDPFGRRSSSVDQETTEQASVVCCGDCDSCFCGWGYCGSSFLCYTPLSMTMLMVAAVGIICRVVVATPGRIKTGLRFIEIAKKHK